MAFSKQLLRAQGRLVEITKDAPSCKGVGICQHPNGRDLALSVLVDMDIPLKRPLPPEVDGYLVITTACGPIKLLQEQMA